MIYLTSEFINKEDKYMGLLMKALFITLNASILFGCSTPPKTLSYEESINFTINSSCKNSKVYYQKANELINNGKEKELSVLVHEWEKQAPKDPELYLTRFMYYLHKAIIHEVITDTKPPKDGRPSEKIYDEHAKRELYVYNSFSYDEEFLSKGIKYLTDALKIHANRFDIWLELVSTYLNDSNWEKGIQTLRDFISQAKCNDNKWLMAFNDFSPYIDNAKERNVEFFHTINQYITFMYHSDDEIAREGSKKVVSYLLASFPNNADLLVLLANDLYKEGNINDAVILLEDAHVMEKDNMEVIANLAYYNAMKNNKEDFDYYIAHLLSSDDEYWVNLGKGLKSSYFN